MNDKVGIKSDRDTWREKAYACCNDESKSHQWIPISKTMTERSEHVTVLMCGACFHTINTSEAFKHRAG